MIRVMSMDVSSPFLSHFIVVFRCAGVDPLPESEQRSEPKAVNPCRRINTLAMHRSPLMPRLEFLGIQASVLPIPAGRSSSAVFD